MPNQMFRSLIMQNSTKGINLGVEHEHVTIPYVASSNMNKVKLELLKDPRDVDQAVRLLFLVQLDVHFSLNNIDIDKTLLGLPLKPRAP